MAGDSELKASRISFRINRGNRVLFGPARFLCAQFAFQPPLAPTFQLVHVSTGTVVRATSTRFSQYYVVRARKPASFWRENVAAIVTLLRVLARMSKWRKQVIKC